MSENFYLHYKLLTTYRYFQYNLQAPIVPFSQTHALSTHLRYFDVGPLALPRIVFTGNYSS
jgi:hypothetical protein